MRKIIIDTDIAFGTAGADIDDAVALLCALKLENGKVIAVTPVGGNVSSENASSNLDKLLKRIGKASLPHGISRSLPMDPSFWVEDRWNKHERNEKALNSSLLQSVLLLKKTLEENKDVTIITIGPMTNIAYLLRQYPYIKNSIKEIFSMCGSISTPGVNSGRAEFNILSDPEAASIVFSSGIPITVFPLDVTKKRKVSPEDVLSWNSFSLLLKELSDSSIAFMEYRAKRDGYSPAYAFFHDVLPVIYVDHPEFFTIKKADISIALDGCYSRGVMSVDFRKDSCNSIAVDVDDDALFKYMNRLIYLYKDNL